VNITRFENLEVWMMARELSVLIKEVTSASLFEKDFRFRDQIRAASGSVWII